MRIFRPVLVCITFLLPIAARAHEFWISPVNYVITSGGQVEANLRVGENFKGAAYSFYPKQFERFDIVQDSTITAVTGRLGDTPALNNPAPDDGLLIIVHETSDSTLSYTKWAKFEKFVAHKAFPTTLADHEARGISTEKFTERYRRFAKSIVAVGDGAGTDQEVGLKTEIVALANPYTDDLTTLPVRVLLDGVPRADVQVELFDRTPTGKVKVTLHRTDEDGVANLPVAKGHEYLADAVTMLPLKNDDPAKGPVWWSLWASLTFMVPE